MSVDILTNEGVRALNHTITTAVKLKIEEAVLVMYADTLTPQTAAELTYPDLPDSTSKMIPTSCLPCAVSQPSSEDPSVMEDVSALDIEFTYLPNSSVTYNLIGVCARYYYEISGYDTRTYRVGDVVSYGNGYYKCKQEYTAVAGDPAPSSDTTHWSSVTVDTESLYPTNVPNKVYHALSSEPPILLYVSQLGNPVTLSKSLEVDYKLRLYLTNVATAEEMQERIYFDTLGPEFSASAQLNTLAAIADIVSRTREVVSGMVARGATFNLVTPGAATSEEEEMKIAYFKTDSIATYTFDSEHLDKELPLVATSALTLNRMDDGSDGANYLSVVGKTRIVKARVTMGGTGALESHAVKAATIALQAYIPGGTGKPSASGSDYNLGSQFIVTLGEWDTWEDKEITLALPEDATLWKEEFQNSKPVAFKAVASSTKFYIQDYNIQDAFVGQEPAITFSIYLELGVSADIVLGSDMTTILD